MNTTKSASDRRVAAALLWLPCLIVSIHVMLCMWGAYKHSPTIDEPAYLASGISHWEFGQFDLCRVTPPLVRLVAAIPVRLANPKLEWRNYKIGPGIRAEHPVGLDFVLANGQRTFWLFTLGRWACIPFTILGAAISYRWAGELFGQASANAALALWCFSPFILAHAQLLTPDIGVSSLCLTACYFFWRWSRSPDSLSALIAGAMLGLAILAKTNAVVLVPGLAVAIVFDAWTTRRFHVRQITVQAIIATVASLFVVNMGYAFEGTFKPLNRYHFLSTTFGTPEGGNRFKDSILGSMPVPLPAAFLEGIDLQRRDFQNPHGAKETYFRGQWYYRGWWWYYLYVALVKVPVGTWILILFGCYQIIQSAPFQRREVTSYVIIPAVALFALACSQTGFGHSLRYVLPALPLLLIVASATMAPRATLWFKTVAATALLWTVCSGLCVYPHAISYFNEIAGGAEHGHFHLLDSNCDAGQDLIYIDEWIANHPKIAPVHVAYWGPYAPKVVGLDLHCDQVMEGAAVPPGWYLISVNHLRGEYRYRRPELEQFLTMQPKGFVTPSIYLYFVP